jgi:hypothetical protein
MPLNSVDLDVHRGSIFEVFVISMTGLRRDRNWLSQGAAGANSDLFEASQGRSRRSADVIGTSF